MDTSGPTGRHKAKSKKSADKNKKAKNRKSDGPTCSMFLAELTKKLTLKRKQDEESPRNIVQSIIESITNALPIKFSKAAPRVKEPPIEINILQSLAPELLPNDLVDIPPLDNMGLSLSETSDQRTDEDIPKMPLINSEIFKVNSAKKKKVATEDVAVNTSGNIDIAGELAKHVSTLRKISMIAEEFNQRTAKNLRVIIDSVQGDLITKIEELQKEQKLKAQQQQVVESSEEIKIP